MSGFINSLQRNQVEKCVHYNIHLSIWAAAHSQTFSVGWWYYEWDSWVLFLSELLSLSVFNCNTDKWGTSVSNNAALLEVTARKSKEIYMCIYLFAPSKVWHKLERLVVLTHFFHCMQFNCRRGATVHFSCDEGYELQGSKSISCLRVTDSYVGWSDDRPICRGKDWRVAVHLCSCALEVVQVWPPFLFPHSGALVFAFECAVISWSAFSSFLNLDSVLIVLLWLSWLWPLAFLCVLPFSHASKVLPISLFFFSPLNILWRAGIAVRLPVRCSVASVFLSSVSQLQRVELSRAEFDSIDGNATCKLY